MWQPRCNLRTDVILAAKMAMLQTAMFPILVICLPKREGNREEKAEAGRRLKRKTRIRVCSMTGSKGRVAVRGKKGRGIERKKVRPIRGISVRFFAAPLFSFRSLSHKQFLSRSIQEHPSISTRLPAPLSPRALREQPFISAADSEAVRRNKSRLLYKCCQQE